MRVRRFYRALAVLVGAAGVASLPFHTALAAEQAASTAAFSVAPVSEPSAKFERSAGSTGTGIELEIEPITHLRLAQLDETADLAEIFHRLQILQQEVRELRGLVEEQAFQIKRLSRQQQEQYIDLDGRLLALRGGAPAVGLVGRQAPSRSSGGTPLPRGGSASATKTTEQAAYDAAFDLLKEHRYQESSELFSRLIADFPNGRYTPTAFYWLGELYLAMEDEEQARQWFAQVLALYPDHSKVPDTSFKLGVVYDRLGDREQSVLYLNRVIVEHPDSPAAGLARNYLEELQ